MMAMDLYLPFPVMAKPSAGHVDNMTPALNFVQGNPANRHAMYFTYSDRILRFANATGSIFVGSIFRGGLQLGPGRFVKIAA